MQQSPASLSQAPHLPLKFVGGNPSLDFINTVDWTARGLEKDRLVDYNRLVEWAEGAGIITVAGGRRLRRLAAAQPRNAADAYGAARRVRWVLQRLFSAVVRGERLGRTLDHFNGLLRHAYRRLRLVPAAGSERRRPGRLEWAWQGRAESLDSLLWPVLRSASDLLTSEEADCVSACEGPDCGWMFVDRSRNGLRRWCEMKICGTREKSRRRAQRRATARLSQQAPRSRRS